MLAPLTIAPVERWPRDIEQIDASFPAISLFVR